MVLEGSLMGNDTRSKTDDLHTDDLCGCIPAVVRQLPIEPMRGTPASGDGRVASDEIESPVRKVLTVS